MRIVFAGTPQTAVPSLEELLRSKHDVVAVLTRPDAAAGRGRHLGPSPVARCAAEAGVEVLKPASPRDPAFQERLRALAPDCCPVTAYGALIPRAALEVPPHGWVNLHFSLLPAWRGAAPVQRAVIAGDEVTGATTGQHSGSISLSRATSSGSRGPAGRSTSRPASRATCATGLGVSTRPRPAGASGRVSTATTSWSESSSVSNEGSATSGVPANSNLT